MDDFVTALLEIAQKSGTDFRTGQLADGHTYKNSSIRYDGGLEPLILRLGSGSRPSLRMTALKVSDVAGRSRLPESAIGYGAK
jgi:hypothetical protein